MNSNQKENTEPKFLTPAELVERYKGQLSEKTLANWRTQGTGPKFTRAGGRILYPFAEVIAWENTRTVSSTSQYGK